MHTFAHVLVSSLQIIYDIDDPLASIYSVTGPPTHVKTKHPLPNLWPFTFLLAGKIVSWQKRENSQ